MEDIFKTTSEVEIDGIKIPTRTIEIGGLGVIGVECGTTGYGGGDSGHGGRTYVRIFNATGDADLRLSSTTSYGSNQYDSVRIVVGGDCEMENLADAFLYASRVLKSMSRKPLDKYVNPLIEDIGEKKAYDKYEKFYYYLKDLVSHYHWENTLRNMSDFAKKYHCKGVTKEQFFQYELHKKASVSMEDATELYDKIFKSEKK